MSIDWDGYELYDIGVSAPLATLPRAEARRTYDRLMQAKPARIEMLRQLLRANGVELNSSDMAIQDVNDWFHANVEADPDQPGRLLADWYSVANDVGLFLGDVIIERHPNLRWEFFTWGKKDVSFQRAVIMGFSQASNPKYNVDFGSAVATYGHRIAAKRGSVPTYGAATVRATQINVDAIAAQHRSREIETDMFLRWLRDAESEA